MDTLGHILGGTLAGILLRRQGGIRRLHHIIGRQFGLGAGGQHIALHVAQGIGGLEPVVVARDGGVVLQRDALAGLVQRDPQAVNLARLVAVGLQGIDQGVAQFIAVAFGNRLDIDGRQSGRQGAAVHGTKTAGFEQQTCGKGGKLLHATIFTIRLGTTITFFGALPSKARLTPSSASAAASTSLVSAFLATVISPRRLPLTWMAMVTLSDAVKAGSYFGQGVSATSLV